MPNFAFNHSQYRNYMCLGVWSMALEAPQLVGLHGHCEMCRNIPCQSNPHLRISLSLSLYIYIYMYMYICIHVAELIILSKLIFLIVQLISADSLE